MNARRKKAAILCSLAAIVVSLSVGLHRNSGANATPPTTSTRPDAIAAPALQLLDLKGEQIDTSSYRGKVVLVNFWAAWCTPCADEVPKLVALRNRHRAEGLEVIGISMEDQDKQLRDFCAKNNVDYPVVAGSPSIAEAYGGILGLPTSILIGRDGKIRNKYQGLVDFAQMEDSVVTLLKEKP